MKTSPKRLFSRGEVREGIALWHGDCLALMQDIPDGCVDLILTDPPYGILNMRGPAQRNAAKRRESKGCLMGAKDGTSVEWDFVPDMGAVFREFARVLRPMGQVVMFTMEPLTSRLRTMPLTDMSFTRPMYWKKDNFASFQNANRTVLSIVEDLSLFVKDRWYPDSRSEVHEYFLAMHEWMGSPSVKSANEACGFTKDCLSHVFTRGYQFTFPRREVYGRLVDVFHVDRMPGFMPYEEIRARRLHLCYTRTFNLPPGARSVSNFFEFPLVQKGIHPTQKPVPLLELLLTIFSNAGDLVLDPFAGSGSTGVACAQLGRRFLGIEKYDEYYEGARKRLAGVLQPCLQYF